MANPASFTDRENWAGWDYELALIFRPVPGRNIDGHLAEAFRALWDDPALDGVYRDRDREPEDQLRHPPTLEPIANPEGWHLGVVTLPSGARVPCTADIVREGEDGDDWIYLSLMQGSLARIDPRADEYQIEIWPGEEVRADVSRVWREPIDRWFIAVARRIYERAPFEWGQISFDITGIKFDIPRKDDHEWITFLVPSSTGLQVIPPKTWT